MTYVFYKYQGAGNDFIIIDNRTNVFDKNDTKLISSLCDRRFGIGADGLILLEDHADLDFTMVYFNSDGRESSMCGNGGRCIVAFAQRLGLVRSHTKFMAIDGEHSAQIDGEQVALRMQDVAKIDDLGSHYFVNTGSPHHIELLKDIDAIDVKRQGAIIRNGAPYFTEGANVNFVEAAGDNVFKVRTYERGVEDETLSCGTGVTAVGLAMDYAGQVSKNQVKIQTKGGILHVHFERKNDQYVNVTLIGPAQFVFKGEITC